MGLPPKKCTPRFLSLDGSQAGKKRLQDRPASVYLSQATGWVSTVLEFLSQRNCHTSTNTDQLPISFVNIWNVKSPSLPARSYLIYRKQSPQRPPRHTHTHTLKIKYHFLKYWNIPRQISHNIVGAKDTSAPNHNSLGVTRYNLASL